MQRGISLYSFFLSFFLFPSRGFSEKLLLPGTYFGSWVKPIFKFRFLKESWSALKRFQCSRIVGVDNTFQVFLLEMLVTNGDRSYFAMLSTFLDGAD